MSRRLFHFALTALLLALASTTAAARQLSPLGPVSTSNPKDRMLEDKLRSNEIERIRHDAEKPAGYPPSKFPFIKDDFERIQIINNALQSGALDDGRVSEAAVEIKKRAARLNANLFPPTTKKARAPKEAPIAESTDLKSLLAELDAALIGFVTNPMFRNIQVVNAPESSAAKQKLERVIKLSSRVKQAADKLKRSNGK